MSACAGSLRNHVRLEGLRTKLPEGMLQDSAWVRALSPAKCRLAISTEGVSGSAAWCSTTALSLWGKGEHLQAIADYVAK